MRKESFERLHKLYKDKVITNEMLFNMSIRDLSEIRQYLILSYNEIPVSMETIKRHSINIRKVDIKLKEVINFGIKLNLWQRIIKALKRFKSITLFTSYKD